MADMNGPGQIPMNGASDPAYGVTAEGFVAQGFVAQGFVAQGFA